MPSPHTNVIRIKNWKTFQHFKDRRPPWIKLYRDLLDNVDWHELDPMASKALVMLWLIASEDDGNLPDIKTISFRLRLSEEDTKSIIFRLSNWLEGDDIAAISSRYQDDAPETETEKRQRRGNGAEAPYAFVGKIIRLNNPDFDRWKQSFPNVDLIPYLEARDVFLFELPEDDNRRRKWMTSTASDLRNKNATAKPKASASIEARAEGWRIGAARQIAERDMPQISEEEKAKNLAKLAPFLKAKKA